jgi:hypothetical protein
MSDAVEASSMPLEEMEAKIENRAKGGDVGRIGNSLCFVCMDRPMQTFGFGLADYGWTVTAVMANYDDEEMLVVISPIEEVLRA